MSDDRAERLFERAQRALRGRTIQDVSNRFRAIVGPQAALAKEGSAHDALEAFKHGKRPTPAQLAALELVVRSMRPSLLSKQRQLESLPDAVAPAFDEWEDFREKVKPYLYAVGRIDHVEREGNVGPVGGIGTGFLVSERLLVTNRHVLGFLSNGTNVLEKGQGIVRFKREYQMIPDEQPVDIIGVVDVHPTLDMALLEIGPAPAIEGRTPFSIDSQAPVEGSAVVAVGYPFDDPARNPLFIRPIFADIFGVKRAAPGEIVGLGDRGFSHDCTTLGGNSGSPVLAMESARVVGLHFSGQFMYSNEAIDVESLTGFLTPHLN